MPWQHRVVMVSTILALIFKQYVYTYQCLEGWCVSAVWTGCAPRACDVTFDPSDVTKMLAGSLFAIQRAVNCSSCILARRLVDKGCQC